LIAVIVAIAVPFAALAYFIHDVVEKRITRDMTEFLLKNKARDVADKINLLLQERRRDLRYWSGEGTAVAALRDPEVIRQFTDQGAEAHGDTPGEFGAFIGAEIARIGKVVKEVGAKGE